MSLDPGFQMPGGFSNVSFNVLSSVHEVGLWFRFHNEEGRLGSEPEYHSWCSAGSCLVLVLSFLCWFQNTCISFF